MVSEPNFVLGIKQTSLANKEDSHVHTAIRSHTYLSVASRLHSILQPSWLNAVFRSSSPSNPCLFRSVHIKPSPVETDPTDVLLGLPRGKPRNPVSQKLATRRHAPQLASESGSRAALDSSIPDRFLGPRAAQTALSSIDLLGLKIWWLYDVACASTRHLGFCISFTRRWT